MLLTLACKCVCLFALCLPLGAAVLSNPSCKLFATFYSALVSYRRWLINLFQEKKEKMLEEQQFLQEELDLTLNCAERYRDNYISWDHRCWLVNHFMFDKMNWLEEELNCTNDWLWTHVSDNCVYHFRQHLLKNLSRSW